MKFIVSSTEFFNHMQAVSRVINSKNSLPILDCVLVELRDGQIYMTASDSETTLRTTLQPNSSDGDGKFAVNSKKMLESLKEIPEQPMTVDVNLESLKIDIFYLNGHYSLMSYDSVDFPIITGPEEGVNTLTLSSKTMTKGLDTTLFATSDDELRPVMTGVYLDVKEDYMVFVGTDSHRLVRIIDKNTAPGCECGLILPKKPANILRGLLPDDETPVSIKFDKKSAIITFGRISMICVLIEGRYPNYAAVIPENPYEMRIRRQAFIGALRRVSIFSSKSSSLIKLEIEDGQLILSSQDVDFSTSAQEKILCEYTSTPIKIGFKSTFLLEILQNIDSDEVLLRLADPSRAGVVLPAEQKEDKDVLMLLMPMMLGD